MTNGDGEHCVEHQRPVGAANPAWRGGSSNWFARKFLPARLIKRFDAIVNSPELTSARELIAVVGTRLSELYEKIDTRESAAAWDAFGDLLRELGRLAEAAKGKPGDQLRAVHAAMMDHYRAASHERRVWDDILKTAERARRLIETENRREAMLEANLTLKQSIALFNRLFDILTEEIQDAKTRARVGQRLIQLVEREGTQRLLPPGSEDAA